MTVSTTTTQTTALSNNVESAQSSLPAWVNNEISSLLTVERSSDFRSVAKSLVSLPAGSLFARISGISTVPHKAYTTVQAGPDLHIELNSDLVFINHSCEPSLEFDMQSFEVRVSRTRDLKKGDVLSFFYPSTEWDMEQPFECWCGAKECVGRVQGADSMDEKVLRKYWLNVHIEEMLKRKQQNGKEA